MSCLIFSDIYGYDSKPGKASDLCARIETGSLEALTNGVEVQRIGEP